MEKQINVMSEEEFIKLFLLADKETQNKILDLLAHKERQNKTD